MKKRNFFVLLGIIMVLSVSCGSKTDSNTVQQEQTTKDTELEDGGMQTEDIEPNNAELTGSVKLTESGSKNKNQKLIEDVSIIAETKNFDSLLEQLGKKIENLSGYIERQEINGNAYEYNQNRNSNLTVRIPTEHLNQFIEVVEDNANITQSYRSTRDVTLEYVDMESHVLALRTEQESLIKILEKAKKVSDIIAIQSQLTQVRYEIESYESKLRTIDNQVTYSTVTIELYEVARETKVASTTFSEEIAVRFRENMYQIGEGFKNFTIWFISSLPFLILWILVLGVLFFIGRRVIIKHSEHKLKSKNNKTSQIEKEEVTKEDKK